MSSEIAIAVENLSKCYSIYEEPQNRLKQFLLPPLFRCFGVTPRQYYHEHWALREVSFQVRKGETVGIVGRNGSGKSTLLQLICGTLKPSAGMIKTTGRIAALLELGSGFNPEFTGRENVYMNASILGLPRDQIDARFGDIAAFADIGEFIEHPVKTYSSGMMMRLAFAVIAHVDADVLVVDEALSVGDAFFTQKCMRFLRQFMSKGSVLFVSHDTSAVVNLCDRAILLAEGRFIETGTPKDIVKRYLTSIHGVHDGPSALEDDDALLDRDRSESATEFRDMRDELIRNSRYRNDIQLFDFVIDTEGIGAGGAKILSVELVDSSGAPYSWIVGGEDLTLRIRCLAKAYISRPIVGFDIRDRLGQALIADNTYVAYRDVALNLKPGEHLCAKFTFRLPLLPTGDYSITAAIAEGSQENHVQHHWVHEALIFKVHASSVRFGLVGVPMKQILLERTCGQSNLE
jgi:lipopolysaccharide transport system ATP-binding protein